MPTLSFTYNHLPNYLYVLHLFDVLELVHFDYKAEGIANVSD